MHTVAVGFGEPLDPEMELGKSGINHDFVEQTGMHYAGIMPLDEVQQRLDDLRSYTET